MHRPARLLIVPALLALLALGSCSHPGGGSSGSAAQRLPEGPAFGGATQPEREVGKGVVLAANKSFAKITYRPEVKNIERAAFIAAVVGVSPDGHTLVFHNAPADIRALKAGDVLLIKNELARKVLAAADEGAETYVFTDSARLSDVVKDGEINIDAPLVFSKPKSAQRQPAAPDVLGLFIASAYAQGGTLDPSQNIRQHAEQEGIKDAKASLRGLVTGLVTSGWTVTKFEGGADDDLYNFSFALAKELEGFIGKVGASGFINNFRFWSNVQISTSVISQIRAGVSHVTGKLHFDWEVAKKTPGSWNLVDPVKLPGTLSVPLGALLGGLPLTLEVSSVLLIHPALTGGDQIQVGGFTITVNGGMNASVASGGAVAEGSSFDQTFQITNDAGISAVAPDAMVIAYAAPRFELQLSPLGSLGKTLSDLVDNYGTYAETAEALLRKLLPASVQQQLSNFKLLNSMSNVVKSSADVYAQLVSTEGVVHSSAISMLPCSKKWIEFSAQIGTAANIAGLTPNAQRSTTVYQKKFEKADPPSNFCEKVGN
jgi:hypothetical protein